MKRNDGTGYDECVQNETKRALIREAHKTEVGFDEACKKIRQYLDTWDSAGGRFVVWVWFGFRTFGLGSFELEACSLVSEDAVRHLQLEWLTWYWWNKRPCRQFCWRNFPFAECHKNLLGGCWSTAHSWVPVSTISADGWFGHSLQAARLATCFSISVVQISEIHSSPDYPVDNIQSLDCWGF